MKTDSSIDKAELNKFNKTHQEWWNEFGEFKILHKITPLRVEYIIKKASEHFKIDPNQELPLANLDVLDVGCGGGLASVPMLKNGANVTGIDANIHNITASKEHAAKYKLNINFLHHTAEEHLRLNKKYDIVICLEVLEHVANPELFIQTLTNLVKTNGMIILSTINRTPKSLIFAVIMAEYILKLIPRGTHDYKKFIKPSELQKMLNSTNLNIKELRGMTIDLPEREWQLSNNIDVNYFAYIT
jgi:2-polyprenyl-6-hydroxyphenyl methylase/3-demethylubiquinone-9 3-methyltransferase